MSVLKDWSKYYPYFEKKEFDCKCGCGLNNMQESHMDKLLMARITANTPFIIRSGSRCPEHNKNSGGAPNSDHLTGHGSDIEAKSGRKKFIVENTLRESGFNRMGRGKTFVHVGDDPKNPPDVYWTY